MSLDKQIIYERLKEIDTIIEELKKYKDISLQELKDNLSLRWIIERGLIACANLIFDIADHILASVYAIYADTYEESLRLLKVKAIISDELYQKIKGLGGFRNILVHEYLRIDTEELYKNFLKSFDMFVEFCRQVEAKINSF
jgi:uncharacterized protein YutE (UPF0331/DUF86 family)